MHTQRRVELFSDLLFFSRKVISPRSTFMATVAGHMAGCKKELATFSIHQSWLRYSPFVFRSIHEHQFASQVTGINVPSLSRGRQR